MREMSSHEIRKTFIDFFKSKDHIIEPSASLIPYDDPSLLWINSGVATLKPYFDGRKTPDNPRITNSQKSIRTNDIENVGKTARHHTFFEMLGNFSIGDYFKKEAIHWAWEFLTDDSWIGFSKDKLSVTIHPKDDEAYQIWHKEIGLPDERIIRLEANFWDIGEGPSGPNTEIFFDRGEEYCDINDPECYAGGENERFLEIWNLVFSQYNHNPDGSYTPLPKKNIDTGMGLERMASIIQGVETNFDTDLFIPIIKAIAEYAGVKYHENIETDIALKVIADHTRTIVFAIGDGALPSNEGRGYIIRRLLRRAARYGKTLGIEKPYLYKLTPVIGEIMKFHYPEVLEKKDFIEKVIKNEEERFLETLSDGLNILEQMVKGARKEGRTEISGKEAFKLYDTFGFPLDLTIDYADENGFSVNNSGFEKEMEEQRSRARAARHDMDSMQIQGGILGDIKDKSDFVGYNVLRVETKLIYIISDNQLLDVVNEGEKAKVILEKTPFYAESGGQVSDQGTIFGKNGEELRVLNVLKAPNGQHLHQVEVIKGSFKVGNIYTAQTDNITRSDIVKNHTATHILHKALKEVLGEHVNQAGSLVAPEKLRFDFSHFGAITEQELVDIELKVNEQLWENLEVEVMVKPLEEAKKIGAMALFGEKYGNEVRVVKINDYSLEFCGGCHVNNSAEIGLFKILSESSIGAGLRRIEGLTGRWAFQFLNEQSIALSNLAKDFKTKPLLVHEKINVLSDTLIDLQKENESLKSKLGNIESKDLINKVNYIEGIKVLTAKLESMDINNLRNIVDELKQKIESGIILVAAINNDKVNLVAFVSDDLVKKGFHAGKLISEAAACVDGGGGGRPDMAQAGGKNPEKILDALNCVTDYIKSVKIRL